MMQPTIAPQMASARSKRTGVTSRSAAERAGPAGPIGSGSGGTAITHRLPWSVVADRLRVALGLDPPRTPEEQPRGRPDRGEVHVVDVDPHADPPDRPLPARRGRFALAAVDRSPDGERQDAEDEDEHEEPAEAQQRGQTAFA